MTGPRDSIPRAVVLAIIVQIALVAVDFGSILIVGLAMFGAVTASEPAADPDVDLVMRIVVAGYGLLTALGFGLGVASAFGLYRGRAWGRSAGMAHGVLALISCSPCNWLTAAFAIATCSDETVRRWPDVPASSLAATFE